ncbi:EamA family transporter [Methanospirillum stamsii]|uniref:Multidrug resistance protein n=1 Tax=Methanospirillum stamsii TaxID=1277351 RepID=A0A2V2N1K4_9EURY|nr:EamA family transporter [Methanospirillum stamsii]PWR72445.1 multidrug resistance protein [Methanospirillum stamsii]
MNTIIIILIGILFASSGQILWKIGMTDIGPVTSFSAGTLLPMVLSPWVIGGTLCYGLSTVFWLIALSRADLSYVYPFIALTFVIIFIASFLLFHENISFPRLSGAIIIVCGIIVLVKG